MASFLSSAPVTPPNVVLGLLAECNSDPFPEKINLTVGAYRDEFGKPYVLPSVRDAEHSIVLQSNLDHEYLGQDGISQFNSATQELMFGLVSPNIYTIQAVAGTGALRLGAEFLKTVDSNVRIAIPDVTWQNHPALFGAVGFNVQTYRYLGSDGVSFDFAAMFEDIQQLSPGTVLLLHSCAHNPSGCDPSEDQWRQILSVVQSNGLFPYFDNAYQGFISGDPETDAFSVRLFNSAGIEMLVACSFSKNFGLYGERIGALHVCCKSEQDKLKSAAGLRAIARTLYSTCPSQGARIISSILNDPSRKAQWITECAKMANRLRYVRTSLYEKLVARNVKGTWAHVVAQRGMFSYSGVPEWAAIRLRKEYHIYLLNDGRISLAGLNDSNIDRLVEAMAVVLGTNE